MRNKNHRSRHSTYNDNERASLSKVVKELEKTVSDLRESMSRKSNDDLERAEKEHFRPFIEARVGHPVTLDNIWKHTRLKTWVAREELLAEIRAVLADIEDKSGFDVTGLLCWWNNEDPGQPESEDPFDEFNDLSAYKTTQNHRGEGYTWAFKKFGGHIRNMEFISEPHDIIPYAAVCNFLGKGHDEIDWEDEDGDEKTIDFWHNFVLIPGERVKIANLRLANERMREMRKTARDAGKEFYWDISTSRHYERMNENYLRRINDKWIRYYVTSTLLDAPLETVDLTEYVSYIPVDIFGGEPYCFDYTPWNNLFDGRNNYAALAFSDSAMTVNRKKVNSKKNIVVTTRGHDTTIDKFTVTLFDETDDDESGDKAASNAKKYCDSINRVGYQLKDSWASAKIVRDNVSVGASSFIFPDIDILLSFSDRDLQKVMTEIDEADLAKVLKARPELKNKIYRNMAKKDSLMLEEDIEYMGPVSRTHIAEAEEKIKTVMRRLADEGKINFGYADDIVE